MRFLYDSSLSYHETPGNVKETSLPYTHSLHAWHVYLSWARVPQQPIKQFLVVHTLGYLDLAWGGLDYVNFKLPRHFSPLTEASLSSANLSRYSLASLTPHILR